MEGVDEKSCLECGLEMMCGECDLDVHVRRQPRATHRCRRNQWQSQAGLRDLHLQSSVSSMQSNASPSNIISTSISQHGVIHQTSVARK